jgi:hypothetical protein
MTNSPNFFEKAAELDAKRKEADRLVREQTDEVTAARDRLKDAMKARMEADQVYYDYLKNNPEHAAELLSKQKS